jgi:hypothetical protein
VLRIRDAPVEDTLEQRRCSHHSPREAESEPSGSSLHLSDVLRGELVERGSVYQNEFLDPVRAIGRELHRDVPAKVHADNHCARHAQHRHRCVDVLGLCGNAKIRIDGTI